MFAGILVDNWYIDDVVNSFGISDDTWGRGVLALSEPCPTSPIDYGLVTSLAPLTSQVDPFWEYYSDLWTYYSDLQVPIPEPSPELVAADPYNQLAWYDSNVWAYSPLNAPVPFPYDPAQYARNSIAANLRNDTNTSCTFLFNTRSSTEVNVPDSIGGDADAFVNTAQAIQCTYEGNSMTVSAAAAGSDFAFTQGALQLHRNHSQPAWGPGFMYGNIVLALSNNDSMAQLVAIAPGGCCMTAPEPDCSGSSIYASNQTVLLPSGGNTEFSFSVAASQYGLGYCNISVSHVWHDSSVATQAYDFIEQIPFFVDEGGPVSCSVSAQFLYADLSQDWYVTPASIMAIPANATVYNTFLEG